ncbi:MAG: DUF421 domain-containing protein [Bradymonadaceae bacterium]
MTVLKTTGIYIAVVIFTRLFGLRSFAKITGFDFAMTVAIGSAIATTMFSSDPPLLRSIVAIGPLFGLQKIIARVRRSTTAERFIDNQPALLIKDGEILWDTVDATDLTAHDLRSKLRQSDVTRLEDVRAVVLETTGDLSVLETEESREPPFDDWIMQGVYGADRFPTYEQKDTRQT